MSVKKHLLKASAFSGGGWWIRTTEVSDNRFTVCPLWPLGKSPKKMELVIGVEPTTCWLQISCSAIEPHQHTSRLTNGLIIAQLNTIVKHFLKKILTFFIFIKNISKNQKNFQKRYWFFIFLCYNIKVEQMERWLSWSKAHDWKSCER